MKKKMKNISKRLIAIALALITMISVLSVAAPIEAAAATYDSYYFPKYTGSSGSIVTALKAIGVDSSFSYRSKIAAANNISGYRGTASQNTQLVNLLKKGLLVNPDAKTTSDDDGSNIYFPKYTGSSGSIVTALKAIGVDSSFSYRSKIAAANNISGYRGTASQNTTMVNLLKKGQLRRPEAPQGHSHSMTAVSGCDNVEISYCSCGYFEAKKQGVVQQNSLALPNNGYIVSPAEVAAALAALKGTAAGIVSLASNPYVIIPLVVSGVAIYAYVHCDTSNAELVDVKRMSSEYKPKELKDGKFYYSAIYHGKEFSSVMILYNDGMNVEKAKKYMTSVAACTGILQAEVNNLTIELGSVYTPQWSDAKKLCAELKKAGRFQYGGDRCADEDIGYNKSQLTRNVLYYEHFHLYYDRFGLGRYEKVNDSHVFFGIPYTGGSENFV